MNSPVTSTMAVDAKPMAAKAAAGGPVTDLEPRADTRPVIRLGFWVLIVGFGLFLAWAAFAPLDEGVSAPATVAIETRSKAVQHMIGGVVQKVLVREGSAVKEGDVLIVLDEAMARASHQMVQQTYQAQRAMEGRLLAEASRARSITFHPDLLRSTDPQAAQHMQVQQQLFASRRAAQQAEIAAANQAIAGLEGQVSGLRMVLENRKTQADLQTRQLTEVQGLAADGFAPRNQALMLQQQQAELRGSLADIETNVQRSLSSIAETRLRIAQREQEFMKEVSERLADLQREVEANQERLLAITQELERMQIRAPVAGQVLGLAINGPGAVVTPGQKLLDIVPQGESLLLDARIPTHVIDRIKVGDVTEVRFSAFANAPQLVVLGRLVSLSADAVTEHLPTGSMSYFLGRVELTPDGKKALGDRVLQPGMSAEVLVKTGERSLLTYLLHPLTKRIASAMTEE
ncbi:MAG: HlyD family type I secretion periplasmic adaptor subunit [Rubrivivax sp.]|jgi:protease secretion system membrane fusion protein|nr:HlyD family type I secretion periplasmic adaptor subunit [Rubrivivax sp.]